MTLLVVVSICLAYAVGSYFRFRAEIVRSERETASAKRILDAWTERSREETRRLEIMLGKGN
ncbi:MAG: hypothetical protein ING19_08865 [Azospirillum sp.]|nr:hypothetical protein [Azospirillum sp.]